MLFILECINFGHKYFKMEAYIRYKRIHESLHADGIQYTFNDLVTEGWEIIYYNEKPIIDTNQFVVTIVAGKRQSKIL